MTNIRTSEPNPYDAPVLMGSAFPAEVVAALLDAAAYMTVSVSVDHAEVGDAPFLAGVTLREGSRLAHLDPIADDIRASIRHGSTSYEQPIPDASHRAINIESVTAAIAWVKVALL